MKNTHNIINIVLIGLGFMFGILASISFFVEGWHNTELINYSIVAGVCFATLKVTKTSKPCLAWVLPLMVWVALAIVHIARFGFNPHSSLILIAIIAACLFVPLLLVIVGQLLPIKPIYKRTLLAFMASFASMCLAISGNNSVITAVLVASSIPLFYLVTKNSTWKERWIQFAIFMGAMILFTFYGSFHFVIIRWIGLLFALLIVLLFEAIKMNQSVRHWFIVSSCLVSIPITFVWSENLITYLFVIEDNNMVKEPYSINYSFVTLEGDTLTEDTFKGKNVAIFFWSTRCGNCHHELPYFSEFANEYSGDTTKVFIAAFVPTHHPMDSAYFEEEAKQIQHLKCVKATDGDKIMKDLDFNTFPQMTFLNKQGEVVYKGFTNNRKWEFVYSPRKLINL